MKVIRSIADVAHHQTECGRGRAFIEEAIRFRDHADEESAEIPVAGQLHRVIAEWVVAHPAKMAGRELRFLRTEVGSAQVQRAAVPEDTRLIVCRWRKAGHRSTVPPKCLSGCIPLPGRGLWSSRFRRTARQRCSRWRSGSAGTVSAATVRLARHGPVRPPGVPAQHCGLTGPARQCACSGVPGLRPSSV